MPAGLGDASLANLPPEAGLYACLFGGLVFWLFCSSRHTTITVTSAISLLIGASLGGIAGGDTARFGALAAATALLVSVIAFVAWLAKAGAIVNFISESVMTGFKCGVALFLASTQLPKLFGFHGEHGDFWENSGYFLRHLNETNAAALGIGAAALAVLVLGKIVPAEQAGRALRRRRRDRRVGGARARRARREAAGRRSPRGCRRSVCRRSAGRT